MKSLRTADFPSLYCDFDETSARAQTAFLRVIVAELAVLVMATAAASYATVNAEHQRRLYALGALFLGVGLILTVVLGKNAYEKTWYLGRASAETVKSLSWKYMMRAAPFDAEPLSQTADTAFIANLNDILDERRDVALSRSAKSPVIEPITDRMRDVRRRETDWRLGFYLENRVRDQVRWYTSKSQHNDRRQQQWFWALIVVQFVALLTSIWQVVDPTITFNISSTLAALAAAILAWLQLKRHRELAQSYSLAAHELGLAAGLSSHIRNDDMLSQFVNDTENAISREHTMWIARRETAN